MEKEYLEIFNEVFGSKTKDEKTTDKIKVLEKIFNTLEDELYSTTKNYKETMKKYIEASEELEETFSKEQQELFEKCWELHNSINAQIEKQLFVFGFLLAQELKQ